MQNELYASLAKLGRSCGGKLKRQAAGIAEAIRQNVPKRSQFASFRGGCFWCVEAVFQRLSGVKSVVSGYTGRKGGQPTYEEVCPGRTGHTEVVQIEFDPR